MTADKRPTADFRLAVVVLNRSQISGTLSLNFAALISSGAAAVDFDALRRRSSSVPERAPSAAAFQINESILANILVWRDSLL